MKIEQFEKKQKGGLKKIGDLITPCRHPEHEPPSMVVLEPGVYEYECPGCGAKTIFTVPAVYSASSAPLEKPVIKILEKEDRIGAKWRGIRR